MNVRITRTKTIGCKGCKDKFTVITDNKHNNLHWLIHKLPNCKHHGGE